jgi:hypothetical protein
VSWKNSGLAEAGEGYGPLVRQETERGNKKTEKQIIQRGARRKVSKPV